jgi:hypothetical protein
MDLCVSAGGGAIHEITRNSRKKLVLFGVICWIVSLSSKLGPYPSWRDARHFVFLNGAVGVLAVGCDSGQTSSRGASVIVYDPSKTHRRVDRRR